MSKTHENDLSSPCFKNSQFNYNSFPSSKDKEIELGSASKGEKLTAVEEEKVEKQKEKVENLNQKNESVTQQILEVPTNYQIHFKRYGSAFLKNFQQR